MRSSELVRVTKGFINGNKDSAVHGWIRGKSIRKRTGESELKLAALLVLLSQ